MYLGKSILVFLLVFAFLGGVGSAENETVSDVGGDNTGMDVDSVIGTEGSDDGGGDPDGDFGDDWETMDVPDGDGGDNGLDGEEKQADDGPSEDNVNDTVVLDDFAGDNGNIFDVEENVTNESVGPMANGQNDSSDGILLEASSSNTSSGFISEAALVEDVDLSGKSIIIWSVDVGAWWSVDNAIYVTDFIREKDVPVTVGVIPITGGGLYELGGDTSLVEYLNGIKDDNDVEIALQGLKFEDNEFYGRTSDEVRDKIIRGKSIISGAVYVEPVTFMPPYFVYDENALIGANDAGMSFFSAGWNAIDNGHAFTEYPSGLMNVPVTTDSYNWGAGGFYSAAEIEEACMNALDSFGTCAIIFQHDTFTDASGNIDSGKIQVLSDVMDWVKVKESEGAILKTVGEHSNVAEPPAPEPDPLPDPEPDPEPQPDPEPLPDEEKGIIVFRSDDYSAYWSVENAITVSETIREMDVPQVLSVIPSSAYGYDMTDDARLLEYLREIRSSGDAEIALHGYNHAVNEFEDLSALSTYYKMEYATDIYNEAFGDAPHSFVPPYNLYNSLTSFYAAANGISVMSAGSTDLSDGSAFSVDRYGLLHLPQTTDIYSWGMGALYSEQEIETSCQQALDKYGACVIVIHHHVLTGSDGSIDSQKLSLVEKLVEWAKEKESNGEIVISNFEDMDAERFS